MKFMDTSYTMQKQIIYAEPNSGRTSIEYSFETDMPEFIQPILNALERVDSFIVAEMKGYCITLFDIFETIVINARNRHVFVLKKDETESSHPTVNFIKKLAEVIYTTTKTKLTVQASDFLANFEYSPPQIIEEIPKLKINKKMPARLREKMMEEYNKKVEEAASKSVASVVTRTSKDILWKSFKNNNQYSFPYLFKMVDKSEISLSTLQEAIQSKHYDIFDLILDYVYDHKVEIIRAENDSD
mmetsp:Transcript_28538/g.32617  ORF Transcript_28538/g.32617 Transcript_28538/m.32617 type:complete len:243 (+) Transcript_28538:1423-2151(+)